MYLLFRSSRRMVAAIGCVLLVNAFVIYLLSSERGSMVSHEQYLKCQEEVNKHLRQITALRNNFTSLVRNLDPTKYSITDNAITRPPETNTTLMPTIYMITPTYARWTQKADLTRLCQTLMHVPKLHWILVEDSVDKTMLVRRFLARCKVESTHLNIRTTEKLRLKTNEPVWKKNRGVEQRNLAVDWMRGEAAEGRLEGGVVYFGDDDNTYDIELFEEMRDTKKVSVWLVGISGGLRFEGPLCKRGKVTGWYTGWGFERPFPIDMAGFAINFDLLWSHPDAKMDLYAARGYLESSLLEGLVTIDELEPKGDGCTKVLVWHTRTETPKTKHEDELIKRGKPSNLRIET